MLPPITHPERVAAASIRGYLYQTIGIALRWLALPAGELLLCEGDEDAEHFILDERGGVRDVTQVQFKDITGALSARSEEVQETIFNFLRAYQQHRVAGRTVRFVFTTSARLAQQRIASVGASDRHAVALDIDVLKAWTTLSAQPDRPAAEAQLTRALRSLVESAKSPPDSEGRVSKRERDHAELAAALAYVDDEPSRASEFFAAVTWEFDKGKVADRLTELEQVIASDPRTRSLPARSMAQRVVVRVLESSSDENTRLRILDRIALDALVRISAEELEAWVAAAMPGRLTMWMTELEKRISELEDTTVAHGARLDDHEARLREAATAAREALRRKSARNVAFLASFRELQLGSTRVHIERDVVEAIVAAAIDRSLVIVGDPGVGKSGVLADVVAELDRRGHDTIVLTADAAHAMGDDLVDVLETWDGSAAGVLVVDALDSLRNDAQAAALRKNLGDIVRASRRWRVVATIRTFDLYQGTATARLFAGSPPTKFADPRFPAVRHIAIDELTDDEIAQLEPQAKRLFDVVTQAPQELRRLLRVPFHLWLAATLLDSGTPHASLASIRTRVGLLDLYWNHRVGDHAASKDAREHVLRAVCEQMIKSRSLQCSKAGLGSDRLYDLLTGGVLREPPVAAETPDDGLVAFGHHVLFDYAVARVWLPRGGAAFAQLLADDPQLLIIVRPSLDMALQRVWAADPTRASFWNGVLGLSAHERVREIGKIIGPGIAAAEATTVDDLQPLIEALQSTDPVRQQAADDVITHLVGALVVPSARSGRSLIGVAAGPWSHLAEAAAKADRASPRDSARRLLHALTAQVEALTTSDRDVAGRAARSLMSASLASGGATRWLLIDSIAFVCRTQASDLPETSRLIQSLLTGDLWGALGYAILPRLAREIRHLLADPDLVRAIYVAAFGRTEESRDPTILGGAVFSLQSNRRQDYEGGLYSLREAFASFLRASPDVATRTLVEVLEAYAEREHGPLPGMDGAFSVDGHEVVVRADYSVIWDGTEHEDELAMADAWENALVDLAADPTQEPLVGVLFRTCTVVARNALIWCRWLHFGQRSAGSPASRVVLPLLRSTYVLSAVDTTFRAGECLRKIFSGLDVEERAKIERAILGTRAFEARDEDADETSARLLGCVDASELVTDEAREASRSLQERGIVAANEPRFSQPRFRKGRERDTDDWLRLQGAPVDEEPHRTVRDASRSLTSLRTDGTTHWTSLLDAAEKLTTMVSDGSEDVHETVVDDAWGEVARILTHVSGLDDAVAERSTRDRIAALALRVARSPCPRPRIGSDADFHERLSWGTPHARGDVASVLVWLGGRDAAPAVLAAVEELANDDVPSVRYRVLVPLVGLGEKSLDLIWSIADGKVADERARGVLGALIGHVLAPLTSFDSSRVAHRIGCLLRRVVEGPGASEVRGLAYQVLADLHLEDDQPRAGAMVLECLERSGSDDTETLLHRLRPLLEVGRGNPPSKVTERQRRRANDLLRLIVDAGARKLEAGRKAPPSDAHLAELRAVAGVLQTAAREIFFASGAHDAKSSEAVSPVDERSAAQFFDETARIMEALARTGVAGIVHSVVETLEHLLPHRPKGAFELIACGILAGRETGYQGDSMAVELFVRTVRRFLAEHRALLQTDEKIRDALLDVLDVFVRAGWPEAQELTHGLQAIFH